MRNRRDAWIQLAILAALGGAVILTMLLPRLPRRARTADTVEISVVLREADSSLWSSARLGMEQAAGELGAELRLLSPARSGDARDQLAILRREAEQHTDVLVVVPADPEGLARDLERQELGLPLVTMEAALAGGALAVPPDGAAVGRELAQAVLADGLEGTVLLLEAGPGDRLDAAQAALEAAGTPVRRRGLDPSAGRTLQDLIKQPDLAAVIVLEPALTLQAAQVKDELGLPVPLYGLGGGSAAAWLERGTLDAILAWSEFAAGYLAVEGAVSLARGQDYSMVGLPVYTVRGEDLYEPEIQKLLFPVG